MRMQYEMFTNGANYEEKDFEAQLKDDTRSDEAMQVTLKFLNTGESWMQSMHVK